MTRKDFLVRQYFIFPKYIEHFFASQRFSSYAQKDLRMCVLCFMLTIHVLFVEMLKGLLDFDMNLSSWMIHTYKSYCWLELSKFRILLV